MSGRPSARTPVSRTPVRGSGFAPVLRAEWVKFRTVRGWVIGMIIAVLVTVGIALLDHSECGGQVSPGGPVGGGSRLRRADRAGRRGGERQLLLRAPATRRERQHHRPGDRADPAGRDRPGPAAAVVQGRDHHQGQHPARVGVRGHAGHPGHGVRMQYDFTGDIAGRPGAVSPAAPRWLRLTRSGGTITGYDSADGAHWTRVGTVHLAGLAGHRAGRAVRRHPGYHAFPAASPSPGRARAARSRWPPATSTTSRSAGTRPATAGPAPPSAAAHRAPGSGRPAARSR